MQGGSALALDILEWMAGAAELLEASFFGFGQLARSTGFNREDVPSRPLGNHTFGGFHESSMLMLAAAMGPTFRPGSFIVQITRKFGAKLE